MLADENKVAVEEKTRKLLSMKRAVIIGAGGTGCHIIKELSHLGLSLIIIDRDVVEEDNLARQVLYTKEDVGKPKSKIAAEKAGNHSKGLFEDLNWKNIQEIVSRPDILIDCTDNIEARLLINDYCKKYNIPWIHTAAILNLGTVLLITSENACYRCTYQEKYGDSCDSNVENAVLENVGKKTSEITKNLLGFSKKEPELLRITSDGRVMKIKTNKSSNCQACKGIYEYLEGKKGRNPERLCGKGRYLIETSRLLDLNTLSKRLKDIKARSESAIITPDFTILKNGRVLVKAANEKEARMKYDKEIGL